MQCQGYHMLGLAKSCGIKSAQDAFPLILNAFCDPWIVVLAKHTNSPYSSSSSYLIILKWMSWL